MTALSRLRLLRLVLLLLILGLAAWRAIDGTPGEVVVILLVGAFRERHALSAFLAGRRARVFEPEPFGSQRLRVAVPGGWAPKDEVDGAVTTVEVDGPGGYFRAYWIEPANDREPLEIARSALDGVRSKMRVADERTVEGHVAGHEAQGVEATLSTWRSLARYRCLAARPGGEVAIMITAYWEWGVADEVVDRWIASVEIRAQAGPTSAPAAR